MEIADYLTLFASLVALLSVLLTQRHNRKQLEKTNQLALEQIRTTANNTERNLRVQFLIQEKQKWVKEFREVIGEILYLGYPDLDKVDSPTIEDRRERITLLAHKVDLMMPISEEHANIIGSISYFNEFLMDDNYGEFKNERYQAANEITVDARMFIQKELSEIDAEFKKQ